MAERQLKIFLPLKGIKHCYAAHQFCGQLAEL